MKPHLVGWIGLAGCIGTPCANQIYHRDLDGDGWGGTGWQIASCEPVGAWQTGDCDDDHVTAHPGAQEICDGLDNDCDGEIDESLVPPTRYRDADQDGFGDPSAIASVCGPLPGHVDDATDCDDADHTRFPGAPERCDGQINACEGTSLPELERDHDGDSFVACVVDEGGWDGDSVLRGRDCDDLDPTAFPGAADPCDGRWTDCDRVAMAPEERDEDGDGAIGCEPVDWQVGVAPVPGDCDDHAAWIGPLAPEICDGVDNRCMGAIPVHERDQDADGYVPCVQQGDWRGQEPHEGGGDCDDQRSDVHPGAWERCDGLANGCVAPSPTEVDGDGDGYVVCALDVHGWAAEGGLLGGSDCDDARDDVFPDAPEICDGADNDCDRALDEDFESTLWFEDLDEDGLGAPQTSVFHCEAPAGYVALAGDCDDHAANTASECGAALTEPWAQAHFSPGKNAFYPGWIGTLAPTLVWEQTWTEAPLAPVVADGRVFVAVGEAFEAYDLATGALLWRTDLADTRNLCDPAIAGDVALVCRADFDGALRAYDVATGDLRWEAIIETSNYAPIAGPTVSADRIFYPGGWSGGITGFTFEGTETVHSVDALDHEDALSFVNNGLFTWQRSVLYRYDAVSGAQTLARTVQSSSMTSGSHTPVTDGAEWVVHDGDDLTLLSLAGEERWRAADARSYQATPVIGHRLVLTSSTYTDVTQVTERATGRVVARLPGGDHLILTEDAVVISSSIRDNTLAYAIGDWTAPMFAVQHGGPVVLAEGHLIIASTESSTLEVYRFP